jgi:hypothetical protein
MKNPIEELKETSKIPYWPDIPKNGGGDPDSSDY